MKETILKAYIDTERKLTDAVARFDNDSINRVPYAGSWTAGQVVDHILKSGGIFPDLLCGKSKETVGPAEGQKDKIKKIFLDFSNKMKSPDFILPGAGPYTKTSLIDEIKLKSEATVAALDKADLARTLLDFCLPGSGYFTGAEWAWFIIYHTQRHIYQLEKIDEALHT